MTLLLSGTNGVSDVDGTAATPALRGSDTNTGIFFPAADTIAFAEGGAEVARFDASGNLGVGTTSPAPAVSRRGFVLRGSSSGAELIVQSTSATDGTSDGMALVAAGTDCSIINRLNGFMTFNTNNTERARITSDGLLQVGTTTFNNGVINTVSRSGLWGLSIRDNAANTAMIQFVNSAGAQAGSITISGTTTTYGSGSDYRLKDEIVPMTGALEKVQALKPVTWKWKGDGSGGQGFIAHELATVCPDAVVGEKDAVNEDGSIKPQMVDTSFLVATLTAAIQELKAIVDAQGAEIAALKGA